MTNALPFFAGVALNPADEARRLVFADWLEESLTLCAPTWIAPNREQDLLPVS